MLAATVWMPIIFKEFLSIDQKNEKALEYLKKGYKKNEIAKIVGLNPNTITKISKLAYADTK
jgi:hypothetical protein